MPKSRNGKTKNNLVANVRKNCMQLLSASHVIDYCSKFVLSGSQQRKLVSVIPALKLQEVVIDQKETSGRPIGIAMSLLTVKLWHPSL